MFDGEFYEMKISLIQIFTGKEFPTYAILWKEYSSHKRLCKDNISYYTRMCRVANVLRKSHCPICNAIRTTMKQELWKRTGEFFPVEDPQKVLVEREKDRGSSKNNGLLLAKFEFLTPKDLEAAVITSEEHRLGTASR